MEKIGALNGSQKKGVLLCILLFLDFYFGVTIFLISYFLFESSMIS